MENEEKMLSALRYRLSNDSMDGVGDLGCSTSQYSSCGESDFEKFYSPKSGMGTPSVCGSVGTVFHDFDNSDLGSVKSFKLSDENRSLRSLVGDRRLSSNGLQNHGLFSKYELDVMPGDQWRRMEELGSMESGGDKIVSGNIVNDEGMEGVSTKLGYAGGLSSAVGMGGGQSSAEVERVSVGLGELEVLSDLEYDGEDGGRCSNDGDTSTRYEHSESEDSMFAYGAADDNRENVYGNSTTQLINEGYRVNENMLAINSSTAFGTDDWDDYVQEIGENPMGKIWQSELPDVISSSSSTFAAERKILNHNIKQSDTENDNMVIHTTHSAATVSSSITLSDELQDSGEKAPARSQVPSTQRLGEHVAYQLTNKVDKIDKARHQSDIQPTSGLKPSELEQDTPRKPLLIKKMRYGGEEKKKQYIIPEEEAVLIPNQVEVKNMELEKKTNISINPLSDSGNGQPYTVSARVTSDIIAESVKEKDTSSVKSAKDNNSHSTTESSSIAYNHFEEYFTPRMLDTHVSNEYFDEVVYDMEEILMDSNKSQDQNNWFHDPQTPVSMRDGGSTASTSGGSDAYLAGKQCLRVDGVEVIGANQKKGDVSFSERLVGVKEYTVYTIRVFSGDGHWEVERRYRDFRALYHSLKKAFVSRGWILPSPWSSVEQESRKIFGTSSNVIEERSALIQECIRSVLHTRLLSSPLDALITFLSPSETVSFSNVSAMPPSSHEDKELHTSQSLGKKISLVVNLWPRKSMKQLLDAQHHTCAGCHRNFNEGKTRILELAHTLGWGRPRLCEYSGQLFCSSCHSNDTAILPARVLHYWDFAEYPVSQMVKSFLNSIYDQPMLCVGAVNPQLFAKVPALQHVTNTRKRIRAVLPYVRCPFRSSIYRGLGSRRYLLESNGFFALRDLIDLSKGVFAALPVMIETVSKKIIEHITEQCLVCCDAGIPCNAQQACDDPSSLIFPFQEGEIKKCKSCSSVFHKICIKKLASCPCGEVFKLPKESVDGLSPYSSTLSSGIGIFSGLLSKVKPQVTQTLQGHGSRDGHNVIRMGSLPSTSL